MSDAKFYLKAMINKRKTKVLFAEIDSDFADVLLSFLTMPLGSIVRVMNKHYGDSAPVLGSLTTLYKGVSDLKSVLFSSEGAKKMLLNPRSWSDDECRKLRLCLSERQLVKYFACQVCDYDYDNVGIYYGTARCSCGRALSRCILSSDYSESANRSDDGVFTAKTASFIICDDMRIVPNLMGSFMETHSALGITDTKDAELWNVTLGLSEIMDLLRGMFLSSTPLTDLILNKKHNVKSAPGITLDQIENVVASNSKKMVLKVMVQKSTNKLLFAQAEEHFVDFLFTLLTIPLGGVEFLLGHNTCLETIDNLYTGFANIEGDKYIKKSDTKSMLLNPKLPHGYVSKGQILPLTEERAPLVYFNPKIGSTAASFSSIALEDTFYTRIDVSPFKSPKGDSYYVNGQNMYMVTDDLTVTPLCMSSAIFHLNRLNIPMSDVEELKFDIGLEEALRILKASLTSTNALTNALLLSKKSLKQEQ